MIRSMRVSRKGGVSPRRQWADGLITVRSVAVFRRTSRSSSSCRIVQAPSAIPFSDTYPQPKEMTAAKIEELKQAFSDAVERCKKAGFDFIEIHGAHVRHGDIPSRDSR